MLHGAASPVWQGTCSFSRWKNAMQRLSIKHLKIWRFRSNLTLTESWLSMKFHLCQHKKYLNHLRKRPPSLRRALMIRNRNLCSMTLTMWATSKTNHSMSPTSKSCTQSPSKEQTPTLTKTQGSPSPTSKLRKNRLAVYPISLNEDPLKRAVLKVVCPETTTRKVSWSSNQRVLSKMNRLGSGKLLGDA